MSFPMYDAQTDGRVSAGSLVLCASGHKPAEKVRPGDRVMTHAGRWREVSAVSQIQGQTMSLSGDHHPNLLVAVSQTFYCSQKQDLVPRGPNPPESVGWEPAPDAAGQYWASPCEFPDAEVPPVTAGFDCGTPDFFRAAGVWLASGWIGSSPRDGRIAVTARVESTRAPAVWGILDRSGVSFDRDEEGAEVYFSATHGPLARWLEAHFGQTSCDRGVPPWLLGVNKKLRAAFVEGYSAAAGKETRGGARRLLACHTKEIAVGMKLLAQSVGWGVAFRSDGFGRWELSMRLDDPTTYVRGGHRYGLLRDAKISDGEPTLYGIIVAGDHSFCADGLILGDASEG